MIKLFKNLRCRGYIILIISSWDILNILIFKVFKVLMFMIFKFNCFVFLFCDWLFY